MIRPLDASDLDAFIQIRSDSLNKSPQAFGADPRPVSAFDRDQTRKDLEAKNHQNFILGYFEAGVLLGMAGFVQSEREKIRHRAFIWGVYVYPKCRGKGVGKRLLQAALERAKDLDGLVKVVLSVNHSAGAAKGLYESIGFKTYAVERDAMRWKGESLDEVFMEWWKP